MTKKNMVPIETVTETVVPALSQFSQVLAGEMDFGGYAGPVGSLVLIGVIIISLAPPLTEDSKDASGY
jgi:hypothetical protein